MPPFDFIFFIMRCMSSNCLEQTVHIPDLHAAAGGDTTLTRTFDDFRLSALFQGHRVDDRFHTHQHFVVHLRFHVVRDLPHARQLAHQAGHAAHVFHLAQLLRKSVRSKPSPFFSLRPASRLCARSTLLSISSISDSTSPMPDDYVKRRGPDGTAPALRSFADAEEFNRFAGNMANRQRRAAAGVASPTSGQHHAGQRQRFVKGLRGIPAASWPVIASTTNRVSTRLMAAWTFDFVHHRFRQRADDRRYPPAARRRIWVSFFQRRVDDINRLLPDIRREEIDADLLRPGFPAVWSPPGGKRPRKRPALSSCASRAGISQLTGRWWFYQHLRPAISTTASGCAASRASSSLRPSAATSSLRTISTNSWPGSGFYWLHGRPRALTRLMKSRTSRKRNVRFQ